MNTTAKPARLLQRSTVKAAASTPDKPEALFHTVRAALSFAYSIVHFPIASSPKLGPSTGASGRMSCLSPQEKHAQGALIRKAAEQRMTPIHTAVTFAFYGAGEVRAMAIHEVGNEVAKLVRRNGLGMELAKRHFSRNGVRKTQEQLSREFGVPQQTVSRLDIAVGNEIDRLMRETDELLEAMFVATGVAEGV